MRTTAAYCRLLAGVGRREMEKERYGKRDGKIEREERARDKIGETF